MSSRSGNNPTSCGASQSHKEKSIRYGSNADINLNQLSRNAAEIKEVLPKMMVVGECSLGNPRVDQVWQNLGGQPQVQPLKLGANQTRCRNWAPFIMVELETLLSGLWQTQPAGRGIVKPPPATHMAPFACMATPAAVVPVQEGWNWTARTGSSQPQVENFQGRGYSGEEKYGSKIGVSREDDDDNVLADSDEDISDDDFDSDDSNKIHGTRKQNIHLKSFFESSDKLTNDQVNETSRQWHCPACKKVPVPSTGTKDCRLLWHMQEQKERIGCSYVGNLLRYWMKNCIEGELQ